VITGVSPHGRAGDLVRAVHRGSSGVPFEDVVAHGDTNIAHFGRHYGSRGTAVGGRPS
jgi:hypothetical protein